MAWSWSSEFGHPFEVVHIPRTLPTQDKPSGRTVAGSKGAEVVLTDADFQAGPIADEDREGSYLVEEGQAILYTATQLEVQKSLVRVYHDEAKTRSTLWRVKALLGDYDWMHDLDGTSPQAEYRLEFVETK